MKYKYFLIIIIIILLFILLSSKNYSSIIIMKNNYFYIAILSFILIIFYVRNKRIENYITIENKNDLIKNTKEYIFINNKKDKFVVIVGEEFWFKQKMDNHKINDSIFLINTLSNYKNYNFIILKTPKYFIESIEKIGKDNIEYIFLFQDVISDSYLNNIKLTDIIYYCKNLEKRGIKFYPGIDNTNLFASKRYYKVFLQKMKYAALPHSIVLEVKKFNGKEDVENTILKLYQLSKDMLNKFDKIVIKKGYSYNEIQVLTIDKNVINNKDLFLKTIQKLDDKDFFCKKTNANKWEIGIDRYYIIQGFNKIVTEAKNEYRIFYINGKPMYVSWEDELPNQCTSDINNITNKFIYDIEDIDNSKIKLLNKDISSLYKLMNFNTELAKEIVKYSKKVYDDFLKYFWVNQKTKHPIVFRIDVTWAEDNIFLDEYSIELKKQNKKVRLYVNELEIDPTHYLYNSIFCKTNHQVNSQYIQEEIGKSIINYINKNKVTKVN